MRYASRSFQTIRQTVLDPGAKISGILPYKIRQMLSLRPVWLVRHIFLAREELARYLNMVLRIQLYKI